MLTTGCCAILGESALLKRFESFAKKTSDVGALRKKQQAGVSEGHRGRVFAPRVGEHAQIKAEWLDSNAFLASHGEPGVEVISPTAIAIVLPAESGEIQHLVVCDDSTRGEAKRVVFTPALADIAVFGSGNREGFIKSSQFQQCLARECKVVGAEEGKIRCVVFVKERNE